MVTHCPRCHAAMILEESGPRDGDSPVWHCLSCGHELGSERERQTSASELVERVMLERCDYWRRVLEDDPSSSPAHPGGGAAVAEQRD